jgi:glycosyltransferase involved in cell wall biosynthesis
MKKKIVVAIPMYNEEKYIGDVINDIPKNIVDEIIVIDDGSRDRSPEIVERSGVKIISHKNRMGFGATMVDCLKEGKKRGDIVVIVAGDGQHEEKEIEKLIEPVIKGETDICLGIRNSISGMPFLRRLGNWWISFLFRILTGSKVSDIFAGFRAYSSTFLLNINFDNFDKEYHIDEQILFFALKKGYRIKEVECQYYYHEDSSDMNILKTGLLTTIDIMINAIEPKRLGL